MIAALIWLGVQSATYQQCSAAIDRGGFVKSQLLECATRDMDRADAALNATYRAVMLRLAMSRRAALRREERAWIGRRRTTCHAAAREPIPSGEISRMLCLVRETDARTNYLRVFQ